MATTDPGERGSAPSPRQLDRGMQFGRFLVTAPLGAGGAGAVYAAYDPELDRRVALKVLHQADESDEDDPLRSEWPRLVREARALARLSHPNVVVVHDIGLEHGRAWLATELVEGSELGEWFAVRPGLTFEEILAIFVGAGRGLAAAHAAGLVHGDFKPANVLVGDDGRARVADFGLARMQARAELPTRPADATTAGDRSDRIVIVGTPYYMAPEQLSGAEANAQSDQYAFCLSLLEALSRRRVYQSASVSNLFVAKQEPLAESIFERLPGWIVRIVARGLSREPELRHASMDALLAAVSAAQAKHARRRIGLGLAGAIVLGASVTYFAVTSTQDLPCEASARHVEPLWNAEREAELGRAFASAQAVLGPAIWSRTAATLDTFVAGWVGGHRNACLAAHHREQRADVTDARTRCLDDRLDRLVALMDLFADADAETVLRADAAVRSLPDLTPCADADAALREFGPPTEDPAAVAAIEQRLRRIDAALFVARYDRVRALLDEVTTVVDAGGSTRGRYAVAVRRGNFLHQTGDFAAAERELESAILGAVAVGDDASALLGLGPMIRSIGSARLEYDEALSWARWREPLATRSGASAKRRADLLSAEAAIDAARHDGEAAQRKLEEAIALLRGANASDVEIALLDVEIGGVLRGRGELERANKRTTLAREIIGRELGSGHPEFAGACGELGIIRLQLGRREDARALLEEAVAVTRAAYGPDHPAIAPALNNLAAFEAELGDYAASRKLLLESLVVERRRYGEDHLVTAPTLVNLATAALWMDEPARALEELDQAERIFRAADPDRPELAGVYRQRSYALDALGRAPEAVAAGLRAVEMFDRHRAADDPARADARVQLGWARLSAGDRDGAKVAYDEAIAILERAKTPGGAAMLADALDGRAEIHAASGHRDLASADRERARGIRSSAAR